MPDSRIFKVRDVSLERDGSKLRITANGIVNGTHWKCPRLVVLDQTPDDSILDVMFVAVPPSGQFGWAFEPIAAHLEVEDVNQSITCVVVYAGLNQEMACL